MPFTSVESKHRILYRTVVTTRAVGGTNPGFTRSESTTVDPNLPGYFRESKDRSWVRTSNYRSLVASGAKLPDNPFYYERRVRDAEPTVKHIYVSNSMDGTNPVTTTTVDSYGLGGFLGFGQDLGASIDTNALSGRILERAKGHQFNAPIFLAEGRKTIDMVVNAATHLTMMVRALRKGDISYFLQNLHISRKLQSKKFKREVDRFNRNFGRDAGKTAANTWLAYKYGWTPFLGDVKSAVDAYFDAHDRPINQIGTVRASEKNTREGLIPQYQVEGGPNVFVVLKTTEAISGRMEWRFSANELDLPARFGLLNPFEVAWELVPFSFVGDWFLPIGSYFSALDAPLRFKHQGGTRGTKLVRTASYGGTWTTSPGVSVSGGSAKNVLTIVQRSPLGGIPMPTLADMRFSPGLNASRLTTSVALLSQQLSRLGRR